MGPGYFVAETYKVIKLMLESKIEVHSILGTEEWIEKITPEIDRYGLSSDQIYVAPKKELESIVGFALHQGLMALGRRPQDVLLSELEDRVLVFDGVVNPENVGSIIRSAAAFGKFSILSDSSSADPYIRRAVRVSMGNVFGIKTHISENLVGSLGELQKNHGYRIIGSDLHKPTGSLANFRFPKKYTLIIGSEVNGMRREVVDACDDALIIPTVKMGYALNASHAATVLLYHASTFSE